MQTGSEVTCADVRARRNPKRRRSSPCFAGGHYRRRREKRQRAPRCESGRNPGCNQRSKQSPEHRCRPPTDPQRIATQHSRCAMPTPIAHAAAAVNRRLIRKIPKCFDEEGLNLSPFPCVLPEPHRKRPVPFGTFPSPATGLPSPHRCTETRPCAPGTTPTASACRSSSTAPATANSCLSRWNRSTITHDTGARSRDGQRAASGQSRRDFLVSLCGAASHAAGDEHRLPRRLQARRPLRGAAAKRRSNPRQRRKRARRQRIHLRRAGPFREPDRRVDARAAGGRAPAELRRTPQAARPRTNPACAICAASAATNSSRTSSSTPTPISPC